MDVVGSRYAWTAGSKSLNFRSEQVRAFGLNSAAAKNPEVLLSTLHLFQGTKSLHRTSRGSKRLQSLRFVWFPYVLRSKSYWNRTPQSPGSVALKAPEVHRKVCAGNGVELVSGPLPCSAWFCHPHFGYFRRELNQFPFILKQSNFK